MPRRKKNPQGGNSEGTNNNNNDVPPNAVGTSRKAETLTAVVAVQQESLALSARTIAEIYKDRWQVELFFKAIKQSLSIKA